MRIGNRRGCREKRGSFINLTNYGKMDFAFKCRGALLDVIPFEVSQGLRRALGILNPPFFPVTPSCHPLALTTSISAFALPLCTVVLLSFLSTAEQRWCFARDSQSLRCED